MVGAIILIGFVLGATLAWAATKFPAHTLALEMCGGALLVCSLALLGTSLY
jgi:galactitol-specific phosphotransferase system IIC component